jgi:hypothetical protein
MGHLILIGRGVADCLEVAAGRDNEVNVPILSMIARAALETGGQLGWLLDDSIDGTTRARRFPTWRFADLRTQRLQVTDFRPQRDEGAAVAAELDEVEHELHAAATAAGWVSKPTVVRGEHLEAAALLDSGGKNERVPQSGELRDSFPARRNRAARANTNRHPRSRNSSATSKATTTARRLSATGATRTRRVRDWGPEHKPLLVLIARD